MNAEIHPLLLTQAFVIHNFCLGETFFSECYQLADRKREISLGDGGWGETPRKSVHLHLSGVEATVTLKCLMSKTAWHKQNFDSKLVENHTSYQHKQMKICLLGEKKASLSATDKEFKWESQSQIVLPPSLSVPPGGPFTPWSGSHTLGWSPSPSHSWTNVMRSSSTASINKGQLSRWGYCSKVPAAVLPAQVKLTVMNEADLRGVQFYVNELLLK